MIFTRAGLKRTLLSNGAFTVYGMAGLGVTMIFTARSAKREAEKCREENVEKLNWKDRAIVYGPALISGAVTGLCMGIAHRQAKRAFFTANTLYRLQSEKVQTYEKLAGAAIAGSVAEGLTRPPDSPDKKWFYDAYSKRYFQSDEATIYYAFYHMNRNFQIRGSASVNEFYAFVDNEDLPELPEYSTVGFDADYFYDVYDGAVVPWIDFRLVDGVNEKGIACTTIYFDEEPVLYNEELSWGYRLYPIDS